MRTRSAQQFASALRSLAHGKKKNDIDEIVRSVVGRFGMTGQMKFLSSVEQALGDILRREQGIQSVSLRVPFSEEKRNRALASAVAKQVGRHADVSIIEDPTLIAGAVITVGDKRYDGSLRARLNKLAYHLH